MSINLSCFKSSIACICEGGAETAIMQILLENNLLIFKREQLIGEEFIKRVSVREFEQNYLGMEYDYPIYILRIIDSRREKFNLRKGYQCQVVEVIDVINAPEIEILIIIREQKYKEYEKSEKKPSEFCKQNLKIKNVKSPEFVSKYFSDASVLVETIKKYHRIHRRNPNEISLWDLINKDQLGNI